MSIKLIIFHKSDIKSSLRSLQKEIIGSNDEKVKKKIDGIIFKLM